MVIGFDVDGVIAKAPLRIDKFTRYHETGWNRLLSTPIGKFFYGKFRRVNKATRDVLFQLWVNGHRIIIATYVFEGHRKEVEKWLKKSKIPFDKLILAEETESPLDFKIRAIIMEGCDFFVEDQFALAQGISQEVSGVRIIYYRKRENLGVLLEQNLGKNKSPSSY